MWNRRDLLRRSGLAAMGLWIPARPGAASAPSVMGSAAQETAGETRPITLFLCGDVMTGRGVDQVLPHPSDPAIHEGYMRSARGYVELAERANGPIAKPVGYAYVWGDALAELERRAPDLRIVNLETSVTRSDDRVAKGINYRMHPENVPCLTAAAIDCAVLANNHVLDWGRAGLAETLETLRRVGIATAGAGADLAEAEAPAVLPVPGAGRVLVFAFGLTTSGIPREWAAGQGRAGVSWVPDLSARTVDRFAARVRAAKRPGDVAVASIHWGGNWGYRVSRAERAFAHALVDRAAVDVVHGHSSHHPKGVEVYRGKPILYGCGDFLNDYEGIGGHEGYRSHLVLMYLVTLDPARGAVVRLEMVPFEIRRLRLRRAAQADAGWLRDTLDRECGKLGTRVELGADDTLALRWG